MTEKAKKIKMHDGFCRFLAHRDHVNVQDIPSPLVKHKNAEDLNNKKQIPSIQDKNQTNKGHSESHP